MTDPHTSTEAVMDALRERRTPEEVAKIRKRVAPSEEVFGLRMRDLFNIAKIHRDLPLRDVDRLLDHPAYEPRMAAICILDFKARLRLDDAERSELMACYLDRHDRITTWDMVDRAAPRVVGGYLAGRSTDPLHMLADSQEPLRRRTAITAPLYFVHAGNDTDVAQGFTIAHQLATDPEPVVHNAVGTFLKHAGNRDRATLHTFLDRHVTSMPRSALRLAIQQLDDDERHRYLSQR